MTIDEHRSAAKRARSAANVADVCGHLAEERGDRLTAAEQLDEREFLYHLAEHHEAMAAYEASITPDKSLLTTTTTTHE